MATNPFNLATPQPVGTPFLANNGNPNTVYNTAATPIQSFGSEPLRHNAAAVGTVLTSPWSNTPVFNLNAAAPLPAVAMPANSAYANSQSQFWRNLSGAQRPVFDLSTSGAINPNPNWPVPPTTTPPATTPPGTTPPPSTGGGGGGGTSRPGGGGRGGGGDLPGTGIRTNNFLLNEDGTGRMRLGDQEVTTKPMDSILTGLNGLINNAAQGIGFNGRDGGFDINQFADALTEIFLPGDLYNENVGSWNTLNITSSILNTVIPGLGRVSQWLMDKLPEGNALRRWMQRNILQNNVNDAYDRENWLNAPQDRERDRDPFRQSWENYIITNPQINSGTTSIRDIEPA